MPEPTTNPQPSAVPATGLLPAPVYFIADDNQIWRLERDGTTKRQITFETETVTDFDIAPRDNALVYAVGDTDERAIVRLDASGRRVMVSGAVTSPRLDPTGERMAYALYEPIEGLQIGRENGSDTGIYVQERAGGRPSVLQASEPLSVSGELNPDARQYYPVEWSPDGTRLLMGVYFPVGEGGLEAVKNLGDGAVIDIQDAFGTSVWSDDGAEAIITGGTFTQDTLLGFWRADPQTGQSVALVSPPNDSTSLLTTSARQYADGTVYVFLQMTVDPSFDRVNPVTPHRIRPDGTLEQLRPESFPLIDALWADDASGAVIAVTSNNEVLAAGPLSWMPNDGGPLVSLDANGSLLRWGDERNLPPDDACGLFTPMLWEPAATRQERADVLDMQRRLLALGFADVGTPDGFYGDQTRTAVQAFQRANGLPNTGNVDCSTWMLLLAGRK